MEKYFLNLANEYEKNGFQIAAADIYKRFYPVKAKRIYLSVARNAEKKGLLIIAAEAYEAAGQIKKFRSVWKHLSSNLDRTGLHTIAAEALEKSKPKNPKYGKTRNVAYGK